MAKAEGMKHKVPKGGSNEWADMSYSKKPKVDGSTQNKFTKKTQKPTPKKPKHRSDYGRPDLKRAK